MQCSFYGKEPERRPRILHIARGFEATPSIAYLAKSSGSTPSQKASEWNKKGFKRRRGRATQVHYYLDKKVVDHNRRGSMITLSGYRRFDKIHLDQIEGCGR